MLYFSGGTSVTVWAGDGARLACTTLTLDSPAGEPWTAAVTGAFLAALKDHFERDDLIELGGRPKAVELDGALLVRRHGEQRTLIQPCWLDTAHLDAYNGIIAGSQADAAIRVAAEPLKRGILPIPEQRTIQLTVGDGRLFLAAAEHEDSAGIECSGTISPPSLQLHRDLLLDGVLTASNVKFPDVQLETVPDRGLIKLYGVTRATEPQAGPVEYWFQTGPQRSHDATPVKGAGAIPAEPTLDEPVAVEALDSILAELSAITGQAALKKQVHALVRQVEINRKREAQGLKSGQTMSHMVFAGPPGTGKTTVARLIARLLHSLGVLEHPEVHEVARPDLVSQNVGGTEEKTAKAIAGALGGVLFIDEVYTLAQGGDNDFGKQAIDVLLKELEDRRSEFVCIVAGYTEQMRGFLDANPGLKSRLPRTIDFTPYSAEELVRIARSMATAGDHVLSDEGEDELVQRLSDEERRGGFERTEWGNARSVRNIIESAAQHRDVRIAELGVEDRESLVTLTGTDIAEACNELQIGHVTGAAETVADVLAELDAQIGQPQLKAQVNAIIAQTQVQLARREHGLGGGGVPLEHLLFVGPPGTGKTTIARLIARLYRALGVLPNVGIVEVDRQSLVAGFVGQTAIQTTRRIDEAMGGVLFLDEAYTLAQGGENDFGKEAIDTLLPRLENDRGKFLAIAAGYPDDMDRLLASNSGLASRFTGRIEFFPYTADELVAIADSMAGARHETLTDDARELLRTRLADAERAGVFARKDWGNARAARNLLDRAVQQRDLRISGADHASDPHALVTLTAPDIEAACDIQGIGGADTAETAEAVLAELEQQIGQSQVKAQVQTLRATARAAQDRQAQGLDDGVIDIPHLLFTGPPGTGKTSIARVIARLYKALGILPTAQVIEVDRAGLVAGYVGQTAAKTTAVIDSALGGVLFIDEAYTLAKGGENDFGAEALDTLMKRMTDDQGKFLVIAAGYPDQMRQLLDMNPGLARRFSTAIEFAAYSAEELVRIADVMVARRRETMTEEARALLRSHLDTAAAAGRFAAGNWGNAGVMENVVVSAVAARNTRIYANPDARPSASELTLLGEEDLARACAANGL